MKYFQHNFRLRDDQRVADLLSQGGYEFYGVFMLIVEEIRKGGGSTPLQHLLTFTTRRTQKPAFMKVLRKFDLFQIDPQHQVRLHNLRLNQPTEDDPRQLKLTFPEDL